MHQRSVGAKSSTMNILFFDTETNGLPIDYKASYTDVNNWPRVIQLAWLLADEQGNILRSSSNLVFPDGWQVPVEKFWIDNGHSTERCADQGFPIDSLLAEFYAAKMEADVLVAHNLNFDHRIVWAEFIRAGLQPKSGMHKICTMMKSTNVCKIPGSRGYKWPKLEELHRFLFDKDFDGAHDALADVMATKDCFFKLVELGHIQLPELNAAE